MNQQINLYHLAPKKHRLQLGFDQMLAMLGVLLLGLVVVSAYESYQFLRTRSEVDNLSQKQAIKNEKLQAISNQVPTEKTRNEVLEEIKKNNEKISEKKKVIGMLQMALVSGSKGYSEYFEALARRPIQGLWLTEIILKDSGEYLLLEGKSVTPENIPKLISLLSSEKIFTGKTFELFKMTLDEKTKEIDFFMETKGEKK